MRRIGQRFLTVALPLVVVMGGCAWLGGPIATIQHPTGDALILRVEYSGGFVGPGFLLTSAPSFTLTGDGRVIVPGPQVAIYPGPAIPLMVERRLSERGIQALLREVTGTTLFGASVQFRGAQNCVADAPDTIFTLHADGRAVAVAVYGLGTVDPGNSCQGMSSGERAAHRALQHLTERLMTLEGWLPAGAWAESAWHTYQPKAMRLVVRNADADQPESSGAGNQLVDWPGSSDPATFGNATSSADQRCGVVSGQEAVAWYADLSAANQLTRFVKGGHRYQVTVRLLLPDEPLACPGAPA